MAAVYARCLESFQLDHTKTVSFLTNYTTTNYHSFKSDSRDGESSVGDSSSTYQRRKDRAAIEPDDGCCG